MAGRAKRATVARSQATSYLAKADQFLRAAERAAEGSEHDAAMLNAIHAGSAPPMG